MNPVDQFRHAFYDKLVVEEKEKEKAQKQKERKCFHRYDLSNPSLMNGYNEWECSKCGQTVLRRTQGTHDPATCGVM